jgi:hypothetical protein
VRARVCVPSHSAQKYKSQFGQINIKDKFLFDVMNRSTKTKAKSLVD